MILLFFVIHHEALQILLLQISGNTEKFEFGVLDPNQFSKYLNFVDSAES